ncbi:odorant receptor 131-2-like [Antennarius striatus]|uniref:odorant receptor 131-2-like n=1 Tax=Antennarius striatus TaxID=241820 RepID=UPI0035B25D12
MNNVTDAPHLNQSQIPVKVLLCVLPCLLCFYVNGVMLFVLVKKPALQESSRYILFGHLLLTDSLQLLVTMLMYIFGLTQVKMISYVCIVITMFAATIVQISPLNLAVMSMERYVAVCYPLRHADIANIRRTKVSIAIIWIVGSLDSVIQLLLFFILENSRFTVPKYCSRNRVFRLQIYLTLNTAFTILYFVSVTVIIIYTYIAIMITVKSASSNDCNATKAHRTVLLHLLQLCLYLTSTLFNMILSYSTWTKTTAMANNFHYALFIILIVFPKCLSPLIYGVRDQTFKHFFKRYFTLDIRVTAQPSLKS